MKHIRTCFVVVIATLFLYAPSHASSQGICVLQVEGVIDPVVADYLEREIEWAVSTSQEVIVIQMDTPGGLMDSMHKIVIKLLNAEIPVVVYVAPSGARAASAGVFIGMAAHVLAMAPGTNIGAAHPVSMGSKSEDNTVSEKVTNDAVAQLKSIAKKRHRNVKWAEDAVRKSVSITAEEAKKQKVIDFIARDMQNLLELVDGHKIEIAGSDEPVILSTKGKTLVYRNMNIRDRFLHALANPNLAYILLILGIYGLIYEFASPGIGLGLAAGIICLILAFFAFQTIPVNIAGLLLLVVGIILLLLEIKVVSYGLLTVGGVACLTVGSFMLIDSAAAPFFRISTQLIGLIVISSVLFFVFVVTKAIQVHRKHAVTGMDALVGMIGFADEDFGESGQGIAMVDGVYWSAEIEGVEEVKKGDKLEVIELLPFQTVKVRKIFS